MNPVLGQILVGVLSLSGTLAAIVAAKKKSQAEAIAQRETATSVAVKAATDALTVALARQDAELKRLSDELGELRTNLATEREKSSRLSAENQDLRAEVDLLRRRITQLETPPPPGGPTP